MNEQITEFLKLAPAKSLLGRELLALQREHEKQRTAFEMSEDKMEYGTSPYRRSHMAIERFLGQWMPRIQKAQIVMDEESRTRLLAQEAAILNYEYKGKVPLDRRSQARVWQKFALERYRPLRSAVRRASSYHPDIASQILSAWKNFRHQMRIWKYGGMPFDGSQAMSAMWQFIIQLDLLAAIND